MVMLEAGTSRPVEMVRLTCRRRRKSDNLPYPVCDLLAQCGCESIRGLRKLCVFDHQLTREYRIAPCFPCRAEHSRCAWAESKAKGRVSDDPFRMQTGLRKMLYHRGGEASTAKLDRAQNASWTPNRQRYTALVDANRDCVAKRAWDTFAVLLG